MTSAERSVVDHSVENRRSQWYGFLAGSLVALVACTTGLAFNDDVLHQFLRKAGDGWGYYQYLPTLIGSHHWEQLPWAYRLENDSGLSLFTCGVAILQFPWFLLGHLLAWASGSEMNGYSAPYAISIHLGVATYVGTATSLLFHALRRRFTWRVALAAPMLLFAGTNLYFYATREPAMSHAYAYFLFAVLHYLVVRNIVQASPYRTAGILVTCSLAVLIRQLHVLIVLFPLLYAVSDIRSLRSRIGWIAQSPWIIAGGILLALAIWVPQLAYWKMITDHFVVFPYGYKGEHFDFLWRPHLLDVLLGVINGWWVYTPLMALVCVWLLTMAWRGRTGGRVLLVILVLVWYTYAAWWCWWLGGAFGHRGFVEYYALLAIPLAWGLERSLHWRWSMRLLLALVLLLLMGANMSMTSDHEWVWSEPDWTWAKLLAEWKSLF